MNRLFPFSVSFDVEKRVSGRDLGGRMGQKAKTGKICQISRTQQKQDDRIHSEQTIHHSSLLPTWKSIQRSYGKRTQPGRENQTSDSSWELSIINMAEQKAMHQALCRYIYLKKPWYVKTDMDTNGSIIF